MSSSISPTSREFRGKIINVVHPTSDENPQYRGDFPLDFLSKRVEWNSGQNVPQQLSNSLSTFANNKAYRITYNFIVQMDGSMGSSNILVGEGYPRGVWNIYVNGPSQLYRTGTKLFNRFLAIGVTQTTYSLQMDERYPSIPAPPVRLTMDLYNYCDPNRCAGAFQYPPQSLNITVILEIIVNIDCVGQNLADSICVDYCKQNPEGCLEPYINFCFGPNPGPGSLIGEQLPNGQSTANSQVCTNFFNSYITNPSVGFDQRIDKALNTYCVKKYNNLQNLLKVDPVKDPNAKILCACNMDQKDYDERYATLAQSVKGLDLYNFNKRCLVGQCFDQNAFKNTSTGKSCPIPACFNVSTINNNGTLKDPNIVINQNASQCANLSVRNDQPTNPTPDEKPPVDPTPGEKPPVNPTNPPTPEQTTTSSNTPAIVFGAVAGVTILILLIVLLVLLTRKR